MKGEDSIFIQEDEIKFRYAINFDLSIRKLQQYFSQEHPKSAYGLIAKYMKQYGFEHRQYSGYVSNSELTQSELIDIAKRIHQQLPWLSSCENKLDATIITRVFDLKNIITLENNLNQERDISYDLLDNAQNIEFVNEPKEFIMYNDSADIEEEIER